MPASILEHPYDGLQSWIICLVCLVCMEVL